VCTSKNSFFALLRTIVLEQAEFEFTQALALRNYQKRFIFFIYRYILYTFMLTALWCFNNLFARWRLAHSLFPSGIARLPLSIVRLALWCVWERILGKRWKRWFFRL